MSPSPTQRTRDGNPSPGPSQRHGKGRGGARSAADARSFSKSDDRVSARSGSSRQAVVLLGDDDRPAHATKSLAQLRVAVDRMEESCEEWRVLAQCELETERQLRQTLADACTQLNSFEAVEKGLRAQVVEAEADVHVLVADLPAMLEGHRSTLRFRMEEIETYNDRSHRRRVEEEELVEECNLQREEADCLWRETEEWRERTHLVFDQCRSIDTEMRALREGCGNARMLADKLEVHIGRDAQVEKAHIESIACLSEDMAQMRAAYLAGHQQREKVVFQSYDHLESAQLARLLEVEDLGRSLALLQWQIRARSTSAAKRRARLPGGGSVRSGWTGGSRSMPRRGEAQRRPTLCAAATPSRARPQAGSTAPGRPARARGPAS